MPRQGGQGKGKPRKNDRHFGRALIKQQAALANTRDEKNSKLSVLDNNALDDFIALAQIDEEDFEVKRILDPAELILQPSSGQRNQKLTTDSFQQFQLVIPRKPEWNFKMTAEEVDRNEKNAFLAWRRSIAMIEAESNYTRKITPFEKNLEVWRQLWRVSDRSDIIIQVVDGRNSLMYFTEDLKKYLMELNPPRPMFLLINKSDLISDYQRQEWAKYFYERNVYFLFYSAHAAQESIDRNMKINRSLSKEDIELLTNLFIKQYTMDVENHLQQRQHQKPSKKVAATSANQNVSKVALSKKVNNESEEDDDEDADDYEDADEEEGVDEDEEEDESQLDGLVEVEGDNDDKEDAEEDNNEEEEEEEENQKEAATTQAATKAVHPIIDFNRLEQLSSRVLNREDLIAVITQLASSIKRLKVQYINDKIAVPAAATIASQDHRACVGMVGYPNVGKSSVINTLLGVAKYTHGKVRVAVSSTPGKTKHFQTIVLSKDILLCDCPGLVFPSFMRNTGEMLCAGILPINQMRDCQEPGNFISARVPIHLLEAVYGMKIQREFDVLDDPNRPPTASEMLAAYCQIKGYITGVTGRWDEFRACKEILRDFNDGKLLYVAMPPTVNQAQQQSFPSSAVSTRWLQETEQTMLRRTQTAERIRKRLLALQSAENKQNSNKKKEDELQLMQSLALIEEEDEDDEEDGDEGGEEEEAAEEGKDEDDDEDEGGEDDQDNDLSELVSELSHSVLDPSQPIVYELVTEADLQYIQSLEQAQEDLDQPVIDPNNPTKREHKRSKRWGKKGRKLRDKDPYRDDIGPLGYNVHFKNRNPTMVQSARVFLKGPN
jgi:large subunit GTPase 1